MGWDGTLWGIDAQGAPHIYDAINNAWAQHGDGIDAAAQLGDLLYFFNGNSFVTATQSTDLTISPPKTIAAQWPTLPDSFNLGVVGAGNFNNQGLILFNGGRYISTDGSIPLTSLTSLTHWPQAPAWKDGVIDGVYCTAVGTTVILMRGNQFIRIDPIARTVTNPPAPLNSLNPFNPFMPAAWLTAGFDAGTVAGIYQIAFKGTALVIYNPNGTPPAQPQYLASFFSKGWPTTWHPVLAHAPNGRDGNLWSVLPATQGSYIVQHNGDAWTQVPNQADHVGVGQDNTVLIASAQKLWQFTGALDGSGFKPVSQASNLVQVSLGNSNTIHARDAGNTVYNFDLASGSLTPNTTTGTATHIRHYRR